MTGKLAHAKAEKRTMAVLQWELDIRKIMHHANYTVLSCI